MFSRLILAAALVVGFSPAMARADQFRDADFAKIDLSGDIRFELYDRNENMYDGRDYPFSEGAPRTTDTLNERRTLGMLFYGIQYSQAKVVSDVFPCAVAGFEEQTAHAARVNLGGEIQYILFIADIVFVVKTIGPDMITGRPILETASEVRLTKKSGKFF